jgi:DNA polymerase elongation subunit (family B)
LFKLSQKIIVDNNKNATFAQAYNISYADIWEFSSEKQGLKKWEIALGIHHMELDIPWDEPVDEKDWDRVIRYCENDVLATEKVLEDRWQDFIARQILAELSGLTVNDTTQRHTAKIVFGDDKNPQQHFVYTDLSKEFDGYKFELGKSYYRGEEPGEGGYVYAEPGIYSDVALLDVASMHPATIERLNMFGKYTKNFSDIKQARIHIKRRNFEEARKMLDGRLAPYLDDEDGADKLAYALKIAINIVYGLTSAKFDNPFRDVRNKDNIAAKRGALFMVDLKKSLQDKGQKVVHIKTDSIKIPNPSDKIVEFVMDYGHIMGYEFEHEGVYEKFCLVNDAVYIAKKDGKWDAVGAQFQHPYVFKSLFSKEEVVFDDYCEGRSVLKGTMYLGDPSTAKEELDHKSMRHLGKTGLFVPVEQGGGRIYRVHEDKYYAVSGTKGYLWVEAEVARHMDDLKIDMSYFEKLKEEAIAAIEQFGSFDKFVS